jgi:hypothetical protein
MQHASLRLSADDAPATSLFRNGTHPVRPGAIRSAKNKRERLDLIAEV